MLNDPESIADRFKDLRGRSGLTMIGMAKAMGLKGASSYQRYEDASKLSGEPIKRKLVENLAKAIIGKGTPPIEPHEVWDLVGPEARPTEARAAASPLADGIYQSRRRRGSSIRDVAENMGVHIDQVVSWEDGTAIPDAAQLVKLASFLRIDHDALLRGEVIQTDSEELGDATFVSGEMPRYSGPQDVEKLGVVAAGDDGDFEFNGKVADYVTRPKGLVGRPGVFALEIISDSMYPAYRKFDPIFCDRQEPQIGDDVVIETFPEKGATVGKAFVKRLKIRTKNTIVVEQFNPPRDITFDPYAIKHIWRVVPNKELHGP